MTIEERAKAIAKSWTRDIVRSGEDMSFTHFELVAIQAATEQDLISRKEERERCIEQACEWLTDNLYAFVSYDENDGIGLKIDYTQLTKMLRKEMEE